MTVESVCSQSVCLAPSSSNGKSDRPIEALIADILENIAHGIMLINTQGRQIYANAYAHRINEQLIAAGREAVGIMPKRSERRAEEPKDDLDDLVDELNDLDL